MSNYIPGVGAFKKRKIRDKRVDELIGAIKRQEPLEKIERAAEKVRDAQLSVLRCLEQGSYRPGRIGSDQREAELANIDRRIDGWNDASVDDIVLHHSTDKVRSGNCLSDPPPGGKPAGNA